MHGFMIFCMRCGKTERLILTGNDQKDKASCVAIEQKHKDCIVSIIPSVFGNKKIWKLVPITTCFNKHGKPCDPKKCKSCKS